MRPEDLTTAPFSLADARAAGLSGRALRSKRWLRIGSRLYRSRQLQDEPWALLATWRRMLPDEAVFAGPTAGWMHGLDLDPIHPAHAILPPTSQRSRLGLSIRRCTLAEEEIAEIRGLRVTTLHRTLRDLCLRWTPVEALVAIDMALAGNLTDREALRRYVALVRGAHGTRRMRWLIELAEAAESPMETRLRWLLMEARPKLPRPQVQATLTDAKGRFLGRADLYFPEARLVVEFDGGNHRDRMVSDLRRQNALLNAGYQMLRFTTPDINGRPGAVAALVREGIDRKPTAERTKSGGFGRKSSDLGGLARAL